MHPSRHQPVGQFQGQQEGLVDPSCPCHKAGCIPASQQDLNYHRCYKGYWHLL